MLHAQSRTISVATVALLFSMELLLTLLLQLPTVAEFSKFAFYDQGASLRLDQLFSEGRIPTVDLGYSYGMFPLLAGHLWFKAFGRTPAAFIAFVTVCNLLGGIAIARFLASNADIPVGISGSSTSPPAHSPHRIPLSHTLIALLLLPFAIMPDNYSTMHPLELACLLLALSQQARGKYPSALAFATAALLTKPSMAYILGFLLLCIALQQIFRTRTQPASPNSITLPPPRAVWTRKLIALVLPAALVLLAGILIPCFAISPAAAFANLLPLTGGRSYRLMNFGFFHAGLSFWLHPYSTLSDSLQYYFLRPVAFWIISTLLLFALAVAAFIRLLQKKVHPTDSLLLTIALLHAAFIFLFYAWAGSWTYYSYLPVLGLLVALPLLTSKKILLLPMLALACCAHYERLNNANVTWQQWHHSPDTANLWTYDQLRDEWATVQQITHDAGPDKAKTLFFINGALPILFPTIQTPESWFLSPGIPTPSEIQRTQSQIDHATLIVLFRQYDPLQEAWYWPEFNSQRAQFDLASPLWRGNYLSILQRRPALSSSAQQK